MERSQSWKSKIGFILAASGAAVGLGNIQRFPYLVAQYGGGAFLLTYLLFVLLLGIPLVLAEFSLGRFFLKNPFEIFQKNFPKGKFFSCLSALPILIPFFIFSYYVVITGWTFSFSLFYFLDNSTTFDSVTSNAGLSIGASVSLLVLVSSIVILGVNSGIETMSKIVMPMLFLMLIFLVINSLLLEKSMEGLRFFLRVDWSKIDAKLFIFAAGQAFFSLCVGEGVLMTYGSYASKKDNLVSSALYMVFFDTFVAFMSGLMIFPALFSFNMSLEQGSTLIYKVMPEIFATFAYGKALSLAFFLTLCFAAITTSIALMEVVVNFFVEKFGCSRVKSVFLFNGLVFVPMLIASLSKGVSSTLSDFQILGVTGFMDVMDFFWGNLAMLFCGMLVAFLVGWKLSSEMKKELSHGSFLSECSLKFWLFLVAYVAPLSILLIFCFNFLL